jgi:hypothetical protein
MMHGTTISSVIFMFFHHIFRFSSTACFLNVYLQPTESSWSSAPMDCETTPSALAPVA